MEFANKKILVSGIAKSGVSSALLLKKLGADVTISDLKQRDKIETEIEQLEKQGISTILGKNPDDEISEFDLIVISPGIPFDLPYLNKARKIGIKVIGEIELAYALNKSTIAAITGTNGKTTTTALMGEIFSEFFDKVYVVGNIGNPFCDIAADTMQSDYSIAEISSFQLETIEKFRPHIAACLNLKPDHLNRHYTYENYVKMKERIYENQDENDYLILNYDDPDCRKMAEKAKSKIVWFSVRNEVAGAYLSGNDLVINYNDLHQVIVSKDKLFINNIENALAAVAMAVCAGIPIDIIRNKLVNFKGVAHRFEYVTEKKGVKYYNDSKATNIDSAIKALETFDKKVILIGGGYNKGSDYLEWVSLFNDKVKLFIVLGETAEQIITTCRACGFERYEKVNSLKAAVDLSRLRAEEGDIVLLSPACASWDMFDNFEQRGDIFKEFVNSIE